MPRYTYKAVNKSGVTYNGTYVAGSKDEVIKMLRNNQSYPLKIAEEDVANNLPFLSSKKMSSKELSIFNRQLYAMLNAGVPIVQSLEILRNQIRKKSFKMVLDDIYEEVQKGRVLSEAMKQHREVFPEIMINMIEAGEVSGSLDKAVLRLSVHFEKDAKLKAKIVNAMIYPAVLAVASVVVVTFLLTFTMPTFVGMFESSGVELPGPTRIVMGLSDALRNYWYVFLFVIGTASVLINRSLNTPEGRHYFDRTILRLPIFGKTMALVLSARFTRTLATLISSGIPLIQSLENIERVIGNKVLADELVKVRQDVQRGASLALPISKIAIFPPMVSSMIHIGEESGALDDVLTRTAEFFDEEADTALTRMAALMEPLMIVIMGVLIGFIVVAMILPIFDMTKTVGG